MTTPNHEFESLRIAIENDFGISVREEHYSRTGFLGSVETAVLLFALGAVSKGFLQEAGKDLWEKGKVLTNKFMDRFESSKDTTEVTIKVTLDLEDQLVQIKLKLPEKGSSTTSKVTIEKFWDEMPGEIINLSFNLENAHINKSKHGYSISLETITNQPDWIVIVN